MKNRKQLMWNITTKFHQNSLITVTIPIYSSQKIFTKLLTYSQHHQNQKKILLSNILVFLIKKISFKFSINFITKTHIKFFYPKKNSPEIIKKNRHHINLILTLHFFKRPSVCKHSCTHYYYFTFYVM